MREMTIKYLIEDLKKYDENSTILFYCGCCSHYDFFVDQEGVKEGTICINLSN